MKVNQDAHHLSIANLPPLPSTPSPGSHPVRSASQEGVNPNFATCHNPKIAQHRTAPPVQNSSSLEIESNHEKFANSIKKMAQSVKARILHLLTKIKVKTEQVKEKTFSNNDDYLPEELKVISDQKNQLSPGVLLILLKEYAKNNEKQLSDPYVATTLHKLYEHAAQGLMAEKKISFAFEARALASQIKFSDSHALHDFNKFTRSKFRFGQHFDEMDTSVVKGGNLQVWRRNAPSGDPIDVVHFKISRLARKDIQKNIHAIKNNEAAFRAALPPELKDVKFSIREVEHSFSPYDGKPGDTGYTPPGAKALEISFEGVGKVIIGNTKSYGALNNDVRIELSASNKPGEQLNSLHQMVSLLGFGPVASQQRPDDTERMKMAQLFHIYCPSQAIGFETNKAFYEAPVGELRAMIEAKVPAMKEHFKKYLDDQPELMKKVEIYPGKGMWSIDDLSAQMRAAGSYGLMSGVGGTPDQAALTIALMIGSGALSSQDRFEAGLFRKGASSATDLSTGGGDQVFTRNVTNAVSNKKISDFALCGTMQILYDVDVVNRGAYGYRGDRYGVRNPDKLGYYFYKNRDNLVDLSKKTRSFDTDNEIMVKNRIPPEFIRGVVVESKEAKAALLARLRSFNMVRTDSNGQELIMGKPIDDFIHIGNKFDKKMWEKPAVANT